MALLASQLCVGIMVEFCRESGCGVGEGLQGVAVVAEGCVGLYKVVCLKTVALVAVISRVTVNGMGKDTLLGGGESLKGVALETGKLPCRLIPAHNPLLGFFYGFLFSPMGSTRDSESKNNYVYQPPHLYVLPPIGLRIPGIVLSLEFQFILQGVFFLHVFQGYPARNPGHAHGEIRPFKVFGIEMHDGNIGDGQKRLITMKGKQDFPYPVRTPLGKKDRGLCGKGEYQSRETDDGHAPEDRPVIELLNIVESREFWLCLAQPDKIEHVLYRVRDVAGNRNNGGERIEFHPAGEQFEDHIHHMPEEIQDQNDSRSPMDDTRGLRSSPKPYPPACVLKGGFRVFEGPAGKGKEQKCYDEDDVLDPESDIESLIFCRSFISHGSPPFPS